MIKTDSYKRSIEDGIYGRDDHESCGDDHCEVCTRVDCRRPERAYKEILKAITIALLLLTVILILTGCSTQQPQPKIIEKVVTQEVKMPVKLNIPELHCSFKGEGLEPTRNVVVCLTLHKRILDIIRTNKSLDPKVIEEEIQKALEEDVELKKYKLK